MELKSWLCRLGATHHGSVHWRAQRVSAVVLVPLIIWLVVSVIYVVHAEYAEAIAWFGNPINAIMMAALLVVLFYHGALGVHSVIEDYIAEPKCKFYAMAAVNTAAVVLTVMGLAAVLVIAL